MSAVSACSWSAGGLRGPVRRPVRLAQRGGSGSTWRPLAPWERNKTLTALAGGEPVAGAQQPAVQRPQFCCPSRGGSGAVTDRRWSCCGPSRRPCRTAGSADDRRFGDRKDGTRPRTRAGSGRAVRQTDNGVVTVTTVWPDERVNYPWTWCGTPRRGTSRRGRTTGCSGTSCRRRRSRGPGAGGGFVSGRSSRKAPRRPGREFGAELAEAGLPVRVGATAVSRDLGARRGRAHPRGGGPGAVLGRGWVTGDWTRSGAPSATGMPETGRPPTPSWADGDRTASGAGRGHRRPVRPAGQGHLEPCHEPAPARWSAREGQPVPGADGLAEIVRLYGIRHWIEQSPSRSRTSGLG